MIAQQALASLWSGSELPGEALDDVVLTGADPFLPSSFRIGTAASVSIAAAALAAAALWRLRTGRRQSVSVSMRHACAEFQSERLITVDGRRPADDPGGIAGLYATKGGWVRVHAQFPHHRDGIVRLLDGADTKAAVATKLRAVDAVVFEDAAAAAGLAVTALRSFAEWDAHPQGSAVPSLPLVSITRIGEAPAEMLPDTDRPLRGVRVLDLTRVIAGPVCGRTLAAHGADVLAITGPGLPSFRICDLGRGKRQAQLDLRLAEGRARLVELVREADVFVQGYRPGAIAAHGFGPLDTSRLRPGIVHASLSAYGTAGPWAARRGFDSLVQTASGFNVAEAAAFGQATPRPLPVQALDHATGYLLAFGIMAALHRRATEGGSWHVEVSLARTGSWIRGLGVVDGVARPDQTEADCADLFETTPSGFGVMRAISHAGLLSETPPAWVRPSVPLGHDPACWTSLR